MDSMKASPASNSKYLLLVHVEDGFDQYFPEGFIENIIYTIQKDDFTKVIHFTSNMEDDGPVDALRPYVDESIDWTWGYEPEMFEDQPEELDHLIAGWGHEWTWIPPELRELAPIFRNSKVVLGGGCHGECLADMEAILSRLGIKYSRNLTIIY